MAMSKNLDRMPYAQAKIVFDGEGTHLISYTTLVCTIDPEGWLSCTGTYSATTRKHISAFMRECTANLCYYDAKACYEGSHELNIHTGEIRMLATC
jgi:hypothetical protein